VMSVSAVTLKNVTFSLPPNQIEKLKKHVNDFGMSSVNAAVRDALDIYIKDLDRKKYRLAMQTASKDPRFIKDMEDTMRDFASIDRLEESSE
jgi:hypothetical protein